MDHVPGKRIEASPTFPVGFKTDDLLRQAIDGMPHALFTIDRDLNLLFVSAGVAAVFACGTEEGRGATTVRDLLDACAGFDVVGRRNIHDAVVAAIASDEPRLPTLLVASLASQIYSVHVTKAGAHWAVLCQDVTEHREAERTAIALALHDPLTTIANRKFFVEALQRAITLATDDQPVWIMLIDLNRFKAVNDTLGHPIGDALLKLVASRLSNLSQADEVVARLGGDKFALLIRGATDEGGLALVAKRVIDRLGRPYLVDGHVIHIGASIGISGSAHAEDAERFFKHADLALYAAKKDGRNTFCFFEPAMDARALHRRTLEIDLRKAITLRQLEVHYQPQVDLKRGVIVGFEALVRWRHPDNGLVLPGGFIALAEEIGLISTIGDWVLQRACLDAVEWSEEMSVAVNVSAQQFENSEILVASIARALKASGLPGPRLEIEVTESVLLRNERGVLAALHQIRDLGVRIAMDDFGTGYSSLSQLNSFPFDKIKIDRSFVTGVGASDNQTAIVRAITALGASLGMTTIAEGVETPEELASIRSSGCTSVQGYLFSKPIPASDIQSLISGFESTRPSIKAA